VEGGRGSPQRPQPRHRHHRGDGAGAGQGRHQQGGSPGGGAIQVDGEEAWGRQLVAFGEGQRGRLGGKQLAAAGVADPQHRLDQPAATVDVKPPRACARPQPHDRDRPGASAHLAGRPPQHRFD
jgi:hypothetical protein